MKAAISRCIIMVTLIHFSVTKFYLMSVKDKKKSATRPKTKPHTIKDGSDYHDSDYSNGKYLSIRSNFFLIEQNSRE